MADYRLYCLDGAGKISRVEVITASDDDEALAAARAIDHPMRCELWLRDRCIAEIGPGKK